MKKQPTIRKTNSELLAELPEPFRKKAIGNILLSQAGKYPVEGNTIHEALLCSFVWGNTVEGFEYWHNAYNQLKNLKNN